MVIGDLGKIVEGRDVCELFFGSKKDFDNLICVIVRPNGEHIR